MIGQLGGALEPFYALARAFREAQLAIDLGETESVHGGGVVENGGAAGWARTRGREATHVFDQCVYLASR